MRTRLLSSDTGNAERCDLCLREEEVETRGCSSDGEADCSIEPIWKFVERVYANDLLVLLWHVSPDGTRCESGMIVLDVDGIAHLHMWCTQRVFPRSSEPWPMIFVAFYPYVFFYG
jgi:hypothetical protein